MTPPVMAPWNLALRFGLELAALAGLALAAWSVTSGSLRWVAVVAVPVGAAAAWGVFNVLDDPSRSGAAPIQVSGSTRLAIELLILGAAAAAFAVAGHPVVGVGFAVLVTAHYLASRDRIDWLLHR